MLTYIERHLFRSWSSGYENHPKSVGEWSSCMLAWREGMRVPAQGGLGRMTSL